MQQVHNIRSYQPFPAVIPVHSASSLRVTHPSAMVITVQAPFPHRLACVKHSVSVHPEPGSNSSFNNIFLYLFSPFIHWRDLLLNLDLLFIYHTTFSSSFFIVLCVDSFLIDEIYYIKKKFCCQHFFWNFFAFFWFLIFDNFFSRFFNV